MDLTDILAIIDVTSGGDQVVRFTEQLAKQRPSYVSGVVVGWRPSFPISEASFHDAAIQQWVEHARQDMDRDVNTVRTAFAGALVQSSVEGLFLEMKDARSAIGIRAQHADMSVVSRPRMVAAESSTALLEAALIASGRPTIVPPARKDHEIGKTILVCWKPSREAVRAIADAGPMIKSANRVVVATVDAKPSGQGYSELPGGDICTHLARGGARVDLVNIASGGRTEAEAIQDQALSDGAALIVIGADGHSRAQEFLFGGFTRTMLAECTHPLFMSH